jgi:hypothetical protein
MDMQSPVGITKFSEQIGQGVLAALDHMSDRLKARMFFNLHRCHLHPIPVK